MSVMEFSRRQAKETCADEGHGCHDRAPEDCLVRWHHANYVLFGTWFSSPAQLIAVKDLGLGSVAMIKKSSRIYYKYK